jgi:hypothetical protein
MYLIEAYLELSKSNDEKNKLSMDYFLNLLSINIPYIDCRNVLGVNKAYFSKFSSKTILYTNFAVLHIKNNDLSKAQNCINIVLQEMDININQISAKIPLPILTIQIYLNLRNSKILYY